MSERAGKTRSVAPSAGVIEHLARQPDAVAVAVDYNGGCCCARAATGPDPGQPCPGSHELYAITQA